MCLFFAAFGMKSIKPLTLFDTKGRNAFFKPLQSNVSLPSVSSPDDALINARKKVCLIVWPLFSESV